MEQEDMLMPDAPPTKLRHDKHGLRTLWRRVLSNYLKHAELGGSMAEGQTVGPWATYYAHPYDHQKLVRLRRRFAHFGWEFGPTHKCPVCGQGRRWRDMAGDVHKPDCRWLMMRKDQVWVTFRRVAAASEELKARGLEMLEKESRRKPRVPRQEEAEPCEPE